MFLLGLNELIYVMCVGLCLAHCGHYGTISYYYFYYLEDGKDIVNNVIRSQVKINVKIIQQNNRSSSSQRLFMVTSRGLKELKIKG